MSNDKTNPELAGFVEGHSPLDPSVPVKDMAAFLTNREIFSNNPANDAMLKAMSDSLALLGDQAAKDGAKDMGEALSYSREEYVLDSRTLESECLPHLRECLIFADGFSKLSLEEKEKTLNLTTRLIRTLNAIADISDAIVNKGIYGTIADSLLDDPSQDELEEYFKSMTINESFVKTFLEPHGISLKLEPIFTEETLDPVWGLVRVPVMTLEHEENTIHVLVVPCTTYSPNWYIVVDRFRSVAMEYMEDANIHIETIATKGYSNVFSEDPSPDEE